MLRAGGQAPDLPHPRRALSRDNHPPGRRGWIAVPRSTGPESDKRGFRVTRRSKPCGRSRQLVRKSDLVPRGHLRTCASGSAFGRLRRSRPRSAHRAPRTTGRTRSLVVCSSLVSAIGAQEACPIDAVASRDVERCRTARPRGGPIAAEERSRGRSPGRVEANIPDLRQTRVLQSVQYRPLPQKGASFRTGALSELPAHQVAGVKRKLLLVATKHSDRSAPGDRDANPAPGLA